MRDRKPYRIDVMKKMRLFIRDTGGFSPADGDIKEFKDFYEENFSTRLRTGEIMIALDSLKEKNEIELTQDGYQLLHEEEIEEIEKNRIKSYLDSMRGEEG